MFQRNVVPLLRYTSSPPVCLCGMYRNICTFYFYWRHVRIATKTYVKKSFTISPIRPKLCKDWPCTSHIALRRQALPSIPKLVSKSSTTIYRSALWKQKYRKSLFKIDEFTLLLLHTIFILECFVAVSAETPCHPNYSTFTKWYCVLYTDWRFESSHNLIFM